MALLKPNFSLNSGLSVENAYIRIDTVNGSKTLMTYLKKGKLHNRNKMRSKKKVKMK